MTVRHLRISSFDQYSQRTQVLNLLNLKARNIQKVRLPGELCLSSFHLDTAISGTAKFLAEARPGAKARFALEKIPIDSFTPVLVRSNLTERRSAVSLSLAPS